MFTKSTKNLPFYDFFDDQDNQEERNARQLERQKRQLEEEDYSIDNHQQIKFSFRDEKKMNYGIFLITFLFNFFFVYPLILLFGLYSLMKNFLCVFSQPFDCYYQFITPTLNIIFSGSVLTILFIAFSGSDNLNIWFFANSLLFFTHILVFTLIKFIKLEDFSFKSQNIVSGMDPSSLKVLIMTLDNKDQSNQYLFDIPSDKKLWQQEYFYIETISLEIDIQLQRFNTTLSPILNPSILQYIGFQLISGNNEYLRPHIIQFITIQIISSLKFIFCVFCLIHNSELSTTNIIFIFILCIFNVNVNYCLSLMLSNYDLRRKYIMSTQINDAIEVIGGYFDYTKKIDITCITSIETWDNSRRCVYELFSDVQSKLEICYICLLIQYIFTINICLAAYGDIYIIISNNSIFLHPLLVISATFEFILLTFLIFFRLYYGQKYNDTFEKLEDSIDLLIGSYEDLISLFDQYFIIKRISKKLYRNQVKLYIFDGKQEVDEEEEEEEEDQNNGVPISANENTYSMQKDLAKCSPGFPKFQLEFQSFYEIIVSKIKCKSSYFIKNKIVFNGKIYSQSEEIQFQQKIIFDLQQSFKRIKKQIKIDSKLKNYKAFNYISYNFFDTILTISLGLITLMPQIIQKFIEQFQQKQK